MIPTKMSWGCVHSGKEMVIKFVERTKIVSVLVCGSETSSSITCIGCLI